MSWASPPCPVARHSLSSTCHCRSSPATENTSQQSEIRLSTSLSVYQSVCFACLSVYLSVAFCLPVCLSVCLFLSLDLSVGLSVCLYLSVCLPACLSVCISPSLCLSLSLSLSLPPSLSLSLSSLSLPSLPLCSHL